MTSKIRKTNIALSLELEALAWVLIPAKASGGTLLSSNKRWDYRPACKDCQPIWVKCKKRQEPQLIVKSRQVFGKITAAAHRMGDLSGVLLGTLCISLLCFTHNDPLYTVYWFSIWL